MAREIVPFIDAATAFGERATGLFVLVWMGLPNGASPSAPITPVVCHIDASMRNLGRTRNWRQKKAKN